MDPDEVAANQRLRMYGAMIEAVATSGYGRTSVKQVVSLAGVSRRAFYEQFANKQECFLATLDLIASRAMDRIAMGYNATEGPLEERLERRVRDVRRGGAADNPEGGSRDAGGRAFGGTRGLGAIDQRPSALFEQRLAGSFARRTRCTVHCPSR